MSNNFPADHHYNLRTGDFDPELNKTIKELVLNSDNFIVYIADDLSIQWRTSDDHVPVEYCGEILNLVSKLEVQSHFIADPKALCSLRRQMAEGLARCLSGQPKENSLTALAEVELQLQARNREMAWKWYFTSAYNVTLICGCSFGLLWLLRDCIRPRLGSTGFEIGLGTLCGAFGALLSVTARGNRLVMDANAGENIHHLEGLSRIGAGMLGALCVGLAIKAGLVLNGTQFAGSRLALLLVFCIVAGASERFIPSLIERLEKTALAANDAAKSK